MPVLSNPRHERQEPVDRKALVAEMTRRIEAMRDAAAGWGVTGPYTVYVPQPLFDALERPSRPLPFDVKAQAVIPTHRQSKHRYGRR